MSLKTSFSRYEIKYMLTNQQHSRIMRLISDRFIPDKYGASTIRNIYFDTENFRLVCFRSAPGTAKEICMIFLAMSTGLIAGMGYIGFSLLFTVITCAIYMLYNSLSLYAEKRTSIYKSFRITVPEDLDYTGVFEEIFDEYAKSYELCEVKSTNMGSLFRLTYNIVLKDAAKEKELIDKIRCRNGNLEIYITKQPTINTEL